ncbi:MAG: hypothetical protein IJE97_07125 [Thermoguttaceae bacterium]|nr:hypothetical protein [Thermoguttaceae bacterium]
MSETYFLVEQAVFEANWTRRAANGRNEASLLSATEGALRADLDAALDWASRVETFDDEYDPRNLFFFPTPSGAFAIGRLTPAARSAEEGAFYFQMFFVEEDAFFQCGANPVALLHLALNTAKFSLYRPDATLEAFRLEARAPWIDQEELRRTTERLGTRALTTLIQAVLDSSRTTFVADYNAFLVVAALFELIPIHWRPELTFAVGVRFRDDSSLRLTGATARRDVEEPRVEGGASFCDLRDVVENDDAYPIENAWAALVELALKKNRVDYLYERMAEAFFLERRNQDDDGERDASSDEVAELGLRWRLGLERAIRGEDADEFSAENVFADERDADEEASDERADEAESFFDGEFEGGWRDSDGDERWRVDGADADADASPERRTPTDERVAPEFIFNVVETPETERVEAESDREKGREKSAAQIKNDNNGDGEKRNGEKARRGSVDSLDDIFAGESFEDEWAATEKRRSDGATGGKNGVADEAERREAGGERTGSAASAKPERQDVAADADELERAERKNKEEATLEALRRVFAGKNGVVGTDGKRRRAVAGDCEQFLELLKSERAFDEPLGLDGLANLSALLDERGAEALERLRRAARRESGKTGARDEDERRAADRDARRLRLAPFAALSAEFPGWNEELRRFDALFDDACAGSDAATETLRDFWRRWRRELDDETVARICAAYEERLRGRLAAEDGGAIERTERLLAALTIYSALFLER